MENTGKQYGFTIVELLIVIVVVGLLATIAIVGYNGVATRASDTRRVSDANGIVKALNRYYIDAGSYPTPTSTDGSWEMSSEDTPQDFLESLRNYGFPSLTPVDPVNTNSTISYYYYRYGAGNYGCDVASGAYFVFGIKNLQASTGPSADSPGWSCPTRNWETEFDWVTGGFER